MVFEFTFNNYRSYKDEATLSFVSKPINEHESSLIEAMDEKLLPVNVIYGPNGGGKSSVLLAFRYMASLIVLPFISMQKIKGDNDEVDIDEVAKKWQGSFKRESYKWDETCNDEPSAFSVLFQKNNIKYRYEISVLDDRIVGEGLYVQRNENDVETIFERDWDDISISERIQIPMDINVNKNLPFLVYLGMLLDLEEVDETIVFFFSIKYINFDKNNIDHSIPIGKIVENKNRILPITQKMGIPICDFRVEYDDNGIIKHVFAKHVINGQASQKDIDFNAESSGTRKIFSLIYTLIESIDNGDIVVIDELDAKLHPLLLQCIIDLFTNPGINKNGAQLLFTSHDIITMSNEVFRRDEIWFAAINDNAESFLYSLADFKKANGKKPRNDEMYGKQYLEGRYGADPYIMRISEWED
ncbi:MAG: ATP-binding protein [Lachnospiraceae bacterium]|nr:ATP-binding protein [Lachnospiraceae bacterium]